MMVHPLPNFSMLLRPPPSSSLDEVDARPVNSVYTSSPLYGAAVARPYDGTRLLPSVTKFYTHTHEDDEERRTHRKRKQHTTTYGDQFARSDRTYQPNSSKQTPFHASAPSIQPRILPSTMTTFAQMHDMNNRDNNHRRYTDTKMGEGVYGQHSVDRIRNSVDSIGRSSIDSVSSRSSMDLSIGYQTVSHTKNGSSQPPTHPPPPRERTSRYLSEGDRRAIISRIEAGEKQVALAKEYGVSRAAICNLYKNRREVLTRVDRDPKSKHPKRQRAKHAAETTPLPDVSAVSIHSDSTPISKHAQDGDQVSSEDYSGSEEPSHEPQRPASPPPASPPPPPSPHHPAMQSRWKSKPFLVHEASMSSHAVKLLLNALRHEESQAPSFQVKANRLMHLLIEEVLTCLPRQEVEIKTSYGDNFRGALPVDEQDICGISMEQKGLVLLRSFSEIQPAAPTGVISMGKADGKDVSGSPRSHIHAQIPPIDARQVILLFDIFCATGKEACAVLHHLVHEKRIVPSNIYFVTLLSSIQGLYYVYQHFPEVAMITGQMDKAVDDDNNIRPGIGNFFERYWNIQKPHSPSQLSL